MNFTHNKKEKKSHFTLLNENPEYAQLNQVALNLNAKRERLYQKRRIFFEQTMHKLSRRILDYFSSCGVSNIYASKTLAGLKQAEKNRRKLENRRFHQIPIIKLVKYIELNAGEYGIKVELINEAYTSKTNVFLNEVKTNQQRKAQLAKLEGESKESEEKNLTLGTTLGGRRVKGKFVIHAPEKKAKNRPYYHSDVGAAANHIQARGEAITWTKEKKHKHLKLLLIKFLFTLVVLGYFLKYLWILLYLLLYFTNNSVVALKVKYVTFLL